MCDICMQSPCVFGCPNAALNIIFDCSLCDDGIISGEEYLDIDGKKYHLTCLEELTIYELAETFGYDVHTATKEDISEYL